MPVKIFTNGKGFKEKGERRGTKCVKEIKYQGDPIQ